MTPRLTIDTRQFRKALLEYAETTRKTGAQIVNQRAYNIAGRAMDAMKPEPGREQSTRRLIRSYFNATVSTRIRLGKSGKRKGKFFRRGARGNQLARVNLIIQSRRAKAGLKGLYGAAMREAEGRFKQAAQVGVGSLKAPFVNIVRNLTEYQPPGPRMKIKTRWGRISIDQKGKWGSSGTINPAKPGSNPTALMKMSWRTKGQPTKVQRLTLPHLQAAFNLEALELRRHTEAKLQKAADKIKGR